MAQSKVFGNEDLLSYILDPNTDVLFLKTEIQKLKLDLRHILWKLACQAPLGIKITSKPADFKPPDAFYNLPAPLFPDVLIDYRQMSFTMSPDDKLARQNFVWKYFGNCESEAQYEIFKNSGDWENFKLWINQMPRHIKEPIDINFERMESLQQQLHSTISAARRASAVNREWRNGTNASRENSYGQIFFPIFFE